MQPNGFLLRYITIALLIIDAGKQDGKIRKIQYVIAYKQVFLFVGIRKMGDGWRGRGRYF